MASNCIVEIKDYVRNVFINCIFVIDWLLTTVELRWLETSSHTLPSLLAISAYMSVNQYSQKKYHKRPTLNCQKSLQNHRVPQMLRLLK